MRAEAASEMPHGESCKTIDEFIALEGQRLYELTRPFRAPPVSAHWRHLVSDKGMEEGK